MKVVLIHTNIANNDFQQYSRVLYTFVSNKTIGQLLTISQKQKKCVFKKFQFRVCVHLNVVQWSKYNAINKSYIGKDRR